MNPLQQLIECEKKARSFGFDWPDHFMILDQLIDECREVREELHQGSYEEKLQEEIGDLLHSAVSLCVFSGFNVEETIAKTHAKFSTRLQLLKEFTRRECLENLHGQSMDFMLALWKEVKEKESRVTRLQGCRIAPLVSGLIPSLSESFGIGWQKPLGLFEGYLKEQEEGERLLWVAYVQDKSVGYVTLKWVSHYPSFAKQGIPEIMDLNVLPAFRNQGIGSLLLDTVEKEAATRSDEIGIGVGLYAGQDGGYGSAQRVYVKRGYLPDGKGITYNYEPAIPGHSYPVDDHLVFWFTKTLR